MFRLLCRPISSRPALRIRIRILLQTPTQTPPCLPQRPLHHLRHQSAAASRAATTETGTEAQANPVADAEKEPKTPSGPAEESKLDGEVPQTSAATQAETMIVTAHPDVSGQKKPRRPRRTRAQIEADLEAERVAKEEAKRVAKEGAPKALEERRRQREDARLERRRKREEAFEQRRREREARKEEALEEKRLRKEARQQQLRELDLQLKETRKRVQESNAREKQAPEEELSEMSRTKRRSADEIQQERSEEAARKVKKREIDLAEPKHKIQASWLLPLTSPKPKATKKPTETDAWKSISRIFYEEDKSREKRRRRLAEKMVADQEESAAEELSDELGTGPKSKKPTKDNSMLSKSPASRRWFKELPQQQQEVMERLYQGYGGSSRRNAIGDARRINVVGEDLCDAIIERMKPSLEKHKGCDIIDVNPGAAVFTTKLHEFLKPRTHVLMEPDTELYEPFLRPLLDAKDSKYTLIPKPGVIWAHLAKALGEQSLPFQKALPDDDERLQQPNDTLLFVANLASYPKRTYKGFTSLTHLVVHQLISAARSHGLIHRYGMVRMLLWFTDGEKSLALPQHVALKKKGVFEAELSCKSITEIASSTQCGSYFHRDEMIDIERSKTVIENMAKLGIQNPPGRESWMQQYIATGSADTGDFTLAKKADTDRVGYQYLKELADLEAKFESGKFEKEVGRFREKERGRDNTVRTPQYVRLALLRTRRNSHENRAQVVYEFFARYQAIMDTQRELYLVEDKTTPEYAQKRADVDARMEAFRAQLNELPAKSTKVEVITLIDEYSLSTRDPPGMMYDRRPFEPIKVSAPDFFPDHPLALLDFEPQPIWPSLRKDFPASYDILDYILSQSFTFASQNIQYALKQIWPGADEWIIPRCPTLHNPWEGGNFDISQMRIRTLSLQMWKEIFEAWMAWPFRPDRIELLGRLNEYASVDIDEGMGGGAEGA